MNKQICSLDGGWFPPRCDFEVQLFDEQGDKQDRFQTKPADKAVSWKNCWSNGLRGWMKVVKKINSSSMNEEGSEINMKKKNVWNIYSL